MKTTDVSKYAQNVNPLHVHGHGQGKKHDNTDAEPL